jgi:hypothetical protein
MSTSCAQLPHRTVRALACDLFALVRAARHVAFCVIMLLSALASSIEARAGATISDRRYWPNEARGSPGQVIEIHPPSSAYTGAAAGLAAEPRPRGKAKRTR